MCFRKHTALAAWSLCILLLLPDDVAAVGGTSEVRQIALSRVPHDFDAASQVAARGDRHLYFL